MGYQWVFHTFRREKPLNRPHSAMSKRDFDVFEGFEKCEDWREPFWRQNEVLMFWWSFWGKPNVENDNPVSVLLSLSCANPPNTITSPFLTVTSFTRSRLINVGVLFTPVSVFTKFDNCCWIFKSMLFPLTVGLISKITSLERYCIDCIGVLLFCVKSCRNCRHLKANLEIVLSTWFNF